MKHLQHVARATTDFKAKMQIEPGKVGHPTVPNFIIPARTVPASKNYVVPNTAKTSAATVRRTAKIKTAVNHVLRPDGKGDPEGQTRA